MARARVNGRTRTWALFFVVVAWACDYRSQSDSPPRRQGAIVKANVCGFLPCAGGSGNSTPGSGAEVPSVSGGTGLDDARTAAHFAVIGDFGLDGPDESAVAQLVNTFGPEAIITTGDNNYSNGEASTIDANIGKYYSSYIHPYSGTYGLGAAENRFFPSLGNHDWYTSGAQPYLDYFTLPGNERYYDFVWGPIHFFAIDSEDNEPDGVTSDSVQAQWLKDRLQVSTAQWNVVYLHEAPYSSGAVHGSNVTLRWPYQDWGADLILNGHNHIYERVQINDFPYITNGLGGGPIQPIGDPVEGSVVRYNSAHGAGFIDANSTTLVVRFVAVDFTLVDQIVLSKTSESLDQN